MLEKEAAFGHVAGKHLSFADVLVADGGGEIFPTWIFRISRRICWKRRDMTGATGNTHAVRTHQFVVIVILRIVDEAIAVPFLARLFVELRIGEEPESKNAGWFAINLFVDPRWFRFGLFVQP